MQEQKDNISQLRKRLQDCEDYILRIAKPFTSNWDKATEEVIGDHLGTRKWILDEMFEKHATEAEVRRFEVVNERLLTLTKQLNERRLNQYGEPSNDEVEYKMRRLRNLRKEAADIVASMPALHPGKVTDRGTNESEVLIFFLEEDDIDRLLELLPKISSRMIDVFETID